MRITLLLAVCLMRTTVALALDDEPDGLSWELFSQDRNILLHFYDWAKTNPPPADSNNRTIEQSNNSQTFPYVWIKPAQIPFREVGVQKDPTQRMMADVGWTTCVVNGSEVLRFKRYSGGICYQTFDVPEDGLYRFWVRYQHKKGVCESNSFQLTPAFDEEHPETASEDAMFAVFDEMFGRANLHMGKDGYARTRDPVPQICDVETPKDGFLWEATHKMAFLKKGRYTARFMQKVVTTPRGDIAISDYALIGDPFFSPEGMTRAACESGRLPVPAETRSPLYAIRPGADMDNASPALRAWWRKWRQALYAKLIAAEHSKDYVWGGLASLPAFDEDLNAVDRLSCLEALAEKDRQMPDTYKINADEFKYSENWETLTGRFDAVSCSHALLLKGGKEGSAEYVVQVRRPGRYILHTLIYQSNIVKGNYRGALSIGVRANGREVASCIVGSDGGAISAASVDEREEIEDGVVVVRNVLGENRVRRLWNTMEPLDLPAGPVTITVKGVHPPWAPKGSRRIWPRIFCRMVLTTRTDFNPPIEHETPWGDRVGTGDIGFWRSPDPWTAFSRYSPVATGRVAECMGEKKYMRYSWTAVDSGEIDCAEHAIEACVGEYVSELLIVRNNTDARKEIEPRFAGDLGARLRLVTWTSVPDGEYVPRFLLERKRIALPAHQNTALWVNIDCRGAKEGSHRVELEFGGRKHVWIVNVKGSIEDVPNPWCYSWAQPGYRRGSWELYRELGMNVINTRNDHRLLFLSKSAARKYGIRLIRDGFERRNKEEVLAESVKESVADWRRRGFSYEDICYAISDEPGYRGMTNWVKIARSIRAADPKVRIWCNTGFFPNDAQWDDCGEFMSYWDVFCPFRNAFLPQTGRNPDHLEAYRRIGNPRLGYITPSRSIYWIADGAYDALTFSELCREAGREGWSIVHMQACEDWDLAYPSQQIIFTGAWNRVLSTRYAESVREANQRWRKCGAGIPKSN